MIKAIALDDEYIALEVIQKHAEKIPYLELTHTFVNPFEAMKFLASQKVDLIFLDINMPDISGLEFLESLSTKPRVIFTTAYAEYAVESYEHEALDYLLKPFDFSRFLKAVNKAAEVLKEKNEEYLFVKEGFDHVRLAIKDLIYAKADGNYVRFVGKDQQVMCRMTMSEAEKLLPEAHFLKTHRSYLVNQGFVEKVERHQLQAAGHEIPVSQTYYEELISRISS